MTDSVESPSGTANEKDPSGALNTDAAGDKVAYETYQRVLDQRKKDQEKLTELQGKLNELSEFKANVEKEAQTVQEEKLKNEGNWKALVEQRDNKIREYEAKLSDLNNKVENYDKNINDMIKLSAFDRALGGKLKKDEYYSFVNTDKIVINPETNQVDMDVLKQYANEFQNNHKELIDYDTRKLPGDAPTKSGKLTREEWLKLPLADKKKRLREVMASN